jgi:hypothetical protein
MWYSTLRRCWRLRTLAANTEDRSGALCAQMVDDERRPEVEGGVPTMNRMVDRDQSQTARMSAGPRRDRASSHLRPARPTTGCNRGQRRSRGAYGAARARLRVVSAASRRSCATCGVCRARSSALRSHRPPRCPSRISPVRTGHRAGRRCELSALGREHKDLMSPSRESWH